MKLKLTIFIYVALLPSIFCDEKTMFECEQDVRKIAKEKGTIEEIFQPLGNQPLGWGSFGFAYRGNLLPIKTEIAMKFTCPENFVEAEEEYQMYSYLEAINNTDVERYGIPVVYYYGKWNENNFTMMGVSLLDKNLDDLAISKRLFENDVNTLIIIRDFILSSKYMHSHAVRHDDIKLKNMMVRKHRTFLIDFNISSRMNERSYSGTMNYLSRRGHSDGERYPKDDWECFLYSICISLGVKLSWINNRNTKEVHKMKENTTATIEQIEKIESEPLRSILVQFAQHVFDDGGEFESDPIETITFYHTDDEMRFPDYNHFYKLVNDEIEKSYLPKPVMFTWLTAAQREKAIDDLKQHPMPDITKIDEPKDYDYFIMRFPSVDPDKFIQLYKDWNASSAKSFASAVSSFGSMEILDNSTSNIPSSSPPSSSSTSFSSENYMTCTVQ